MIVIAGKNNIAVHGLSLALQHFEANNIVVIPNENDMGVDGWQRSLLKYAKKNNVHVKTLSDIYQLKVSIFISLEFDKIVNPNKISTNKIYNIHFSNLPKYKGMHTSVWPILHGDSESAVTLHKIDQGIDTGDIIAKKIFCINSSDRSQDCYRKYIENSKALLSDWFIRIVNGEFSAKEQSADKSTYFSAKSIDYSKLKINFNKTAWQIQRDVYSLSFRPYQLLDFNGDKISDVIISSDKSKSKPGTILTKNKDYVIIATIDYNVVIYFDRLDELLNNIPSISTSDFSKKIVNILGVNDRNNKGWSPIIVAAYYGRRDIINFLLEIGANINDANYHGTTVLMYGKDFSLKNNDSSFMRFLLSNGADPKLKDWSGKSVSDYITASQAKFLGL